MGYDWADPEVGPEDGTQDEVEDKEWKDATRKAEEVKDMGLLLL